VDMPLLVRRTVQRRATKTANVDPHDLFKFICSDDPFEFMTPFREEFSGLASPSSNAIHNELIDRLVCV
jgi:hypothetical protein